MMMITAGCCRHGFMPTQMMSRQQRVASTIIRRRRLIVSPQQRQPSAPAPAATRRRQQRQPVFSVSCRRHYEPQHQQGLREGTIDHQVVRRYYSNSRRRCAAGKGNSHRQKRLRIRHEKTKDKKQMKRAASEDAKLRLQETETKSTTTTADTITTSSSISANRFSSKIQQQRQRAVFAAWFTPVRYHAAAAASSSSSSPAAAVSQHRRYTRQHVEATLYRVPLFMAIVVVGWLWEETAPFSLQSVLGHSMIPTMMPDGSDIWLFLNFKWIRHLSSLLLLIGGVGGDASTASASLIQRGDLVMFHYPTDQATTAIDSNQGQQQQQQQQLSSPASSSGVVKRVVGLPGDEVLRYGQYGHLYYQDQNDDSSGGGGVDRFGIPWPSENDPRRQQYGIDRACPWDDVDGRKQQPPKQQDDEEWRRTIIVPEHHVWIESDNPAAGLDSRQYGPIPVSCITGKAIARIWPFWCRSYLDDEDGDSNGALRHEQDWRKRPYPIPQDEKTLARYNVHIRPKAKDALSSSEQD